MSFPWLTWLVDTGQRLRTVDGKTVEVWELRHDDCQETLSAWSRHLRNHYCLDTEIDYYRRGYNYSRAEYLNNIKFPDATNAPGPSIRAGDFAEILVADYLERLLAYWVPRTRYCDKAVRNESEKGCDIVGFKIFGNGAPAPDDTLAIFESKAQFSGDRPKPRLQDAVAGSAKDPIRRGESLNAIKQRLFERHLTEDADKVERFQSPEDLPYTEVFGAVALFSAPLFDPQVVSATDTTLHPRSGNLALLVIHGPIMMELVHELYRRAADEA